jgi:hypothetical protein
VKIKIFVPLRRLSLLPFRGPPYALCAYAYGTPNGTIGVGRTGGIGIGVGIGKRDKERSGGIDNGFRDGYTQSVPHLFLVLIQKRDDVL